MEGVDDSHIMKTAEKVAKGGEQNTRKPRKRSEWQEKIMNLAERLADDDDRVNLNMLRASAKAIGMKHDSTWKRTIESLKERRDVAIDNENNALEIL